LDYRGGDDANLIVDKVIPIEQLDQNLTHGVKIMIDQTVHGEDGLKNAYEIIRGYPGSRELKIEIILEDGMRVEMASNRTIDITEELDRRLSDLLGKTCVEMLIDRKSLSAKAPEKKWARS
jgi:DNA polymerase-3 subunit alpha